MLDAAPGGFSDALAIDPTALGALPADQSGLDGRHVVIADAQGEHRLWVRNTTPGKPLAALIPLDRDFETRIASLMRFHRRLFGRPTGPPPRGWPLTPYRRLRLEQMLVALDIKLAGGNYRDIAAALGDDDAAALPAIEWKDSRARSFSIRLVRAATTMMNGGYRKLLSIR
ncbi:DUF2285 domain-containing protein [Sphingobium aquiterrae]|uniref:DUF2285 domain-containing protein n=1 Tax=Sphingobium aquiterrae TaxID=2038656 RepID=UPI003016E279